MKFETFIAWRYMTAKHRNRYINVTTIFAVGGILVGVAALLVVLSVMNGLEDEIRQRIINTTAHITIYSYRVEGIDRWKERLRVIQDYPDVIAASPFVYAKGAISGPKSADGVLIRGVVPELERKTTTVPEQIKAGEFFLGDTGMPKIVLGRFLAEQIGAGVGDTVTLFVLRRSKIPFGVGAPTSMRFVVSGIFETGLYDYDATFCYISISDGQRLFGMGNRISGFQAKVKDCYKAPSIAKRLEEYLGLPFYTIPWTEVNKTLFSWMMIEKWAMFLVLALIIVVAAFNIISTLMMIVMEKTADIGVLKAIGAKETSIVKIFLIQGFIVGVLGTSLGTLLGGAIIFVQNKFHIISLPPEIYSVSSLPMHPRLLDFVVVVLFSMFLSVLSAFYPAWKAAKLKPVDAIHYG
ncbi:ABC transporter permease [bacterium]|nr:ABC transporter permease [bacterium]